MINLDQLDEVRAAEEKARAGKGAKAGICLCGHPMKKHLPVDGTSDSGLCKVLKDRCGCNRPTEAIQVPNARYYMYGNDIGHSLVRGIARTVDATGMDSIEYTTEVACMYFVDEDSEERCGSVDDVRIVREVLGDLGGYPVASNGYLCKSHRVVAGEKVGR